jgi:hypothetical protein
MTFYDYGTSPEQEPKFTDPREKDRAEIQAILESGRLAIEHANQAIVRIDNTLRESKERSEPHLQVLRDAGLIR